MINSSIILQKSQILRQVVLISNTPSELLGSHLVEVAFIGEFHIMKIIEG